MAFKEIDLQRNNLAKKLGALLPQIDPRVQWVDYIPGAALRTGASLVAIGVEKGVVKYVDISHKSPFKMVNEVLNAMDDYRLDTQFLNSRQLSIIKDDISTLAKDRAKVANETLTMLEKCELSDKDCLEIVSQAQVVGVFPDFFPETKEQVSITPQILKHFLKTNRATFMDTQIIADLVSRQIKLAVKKNSINKNSIENTTKDEEFEYEAG